MKGSATPPIRFHLSMSFSLPNRLKLKKAVRQLFKQEKRVLQSLNIIFCSDDYLLRINQDYLYHEDLTDIITFDLSDTPDLIAGELYISIERVRENAQIFETEFLHELNRVVFHGCLHLCGYEDKSSEAQKSMRSKEAFYLAAYFEGYQPG